MASHPASHPPQHPEFVGGEETALADKVSFLSSARSYAHAPAQVIAKETHMSWVFLAGDTVFKLKKPVRYPYLDFSTLEAREKFCREEVRLNRRLAPGVYRRVIPLRRACNGELTLESVGKVVDWLIEMRRLPADRMLDVRLRANLVERTDAERLAGVLAVFYTQADHPRIDSGICFRRFQSEMLEDREVLASLIPASDRPRVEALLDRVDAALQMARQMLEERARSGHIVEGHGDLRPEHICMTDPIVVFDCLEFNYELRLLDPLDELASVGMECDFLGAAWFGAMLIRDVEALLGEALSEDMLRLYTALHAVLRARLSLAHLLDPVPREPAKWRPQARRYLELAERALG
jgi:aminoglycoside phosphotransferase family enzyme